MVLEIVCCLGDSPDRRGSLPGHSATGGPPASDGHTPGKRKPLFMKHSLGKRELR